MSKILYFDCFAGISGDMTLGALLDAGADLGYLRDQLSQLNLGDVEIKARKTTRRGIAATDVQVDWPGKAESHQSHAAADAEDYHTVSSSRHQHHHPHRQNEATAQGGATRPPVHLPNRNPVDIEALISKSQLSERVKTVSLKIFQRLAQAEAQVHGRSIEEVHFHEVGAVDSIVDIVGTAVCLDYLGIGRIYSSPLHLGGGFLQCAHGTLPAEAPATMAMLGGVPVYSTGIRHEMVTPTGAAIITSLAESFVPLPETVVERVGYGAGDRELEIPNLLRVILAEESTPALLLLESNIDDMNPQVYSHLFPLLFEEGAADVYLIPAIMKKNRPGAILCVLCPVTAADRLEQVIFLETTTLGIRRAPVTRSSLQREIRQVETPWGQVRIKAAFRDGRVLKLAAEFDDCSRIARERRLPLQEVMRTAVRVAEQSLMPDR